MAAVRVRKYLAGATATAIVVVCLVLIYATLLTFEFGEVPNAEIEHSLAVVRDARAELRPPGWEKPAYCASFSRHMESSEVAISPRELSAWKFYPRPAEPPPAPVVAVDPPGTVRAALSVPALTVAAEKSRGAVLGIALDPSDKYCAARVILVWRRKHSEPAWPKDPMLTLRVTADGSHASKPAGAIREGTGRFLYVDKPPAGRGSFVYHARALGVFRKQVTEGRGAAAKVRGVLAPKENSGVVRVRRFDTVLDGAYATGYSPEVRAAFAGQVQVKFRTADRDLRRAWISIRRFLPGRPEPLLPNREWKNPRRVFAPVFRKKALLRARWMGRDGARSVVKNVDAQLRLDEVKVETRKVPATRDVWKRDEATGLITRVTEHYTIEKKVIVAELTDLANGARVKLDKGSDWWPADAGGRGGARGSTAAGPGRRR